MTERLAPDARVLVISVARLGDTLLLTPLLRALKEASPRGRLAVLAHPRSVDILRNLPFVDELSTIKPRIARWRGWLQGSRWDYALVLERNPVLIRYASRVATRVVAFRTEDAATNALLWRAVPLPTEPTHAVRQRLLLTEAMGLTTSELQLRYVVTEDEHRAVRNWLTARGIDRVRPLIGFQMASFPGKAYRDWPADHFIDLGRRILDAYPGAHILLLGGPESRDKASQVAGVLGRSTSAAGAFDIRGAAALIASLDLYVGVDTGPTHLAGALGVPMVALYHCRHRGNLLAPLDHPHLRIVDHPADDAHCSHGTPMADIPVSTVWQQAKELLG